MAHSCSNAIRSSPRRAANTYAPPIPLEDLHILDFLELSGSQAKAGAALAMHQSTVCRSVRLMQQQFQLKPDRGRKVCRHGYNECLDYLRLAYRAHRLMEGLLRIGSELVRHGLLDGAIVGSFCLEKPLLCGQAPTWDGVAALPLGQLELQLVSTTPATRQVLLPRRISMPLLHDAIEWHGYGVDQQPALIEQLWLLLPQGEVNSSAARRCIRRLRAQVSKAVSYVAMAV